MFHDRIGLGIDLHRPGRKRSREEAVPTRSDAEAGAQSASFLQAIGDRRHIALDVKSTDVKEFESVSAAQRFPNGNIYLHDGTGTKYVAFKTNNTYTSVQSLSIWGNDTHPFDLYGVGAATEDNQSSRTIHFIVRSFTTTPVHWIKASQLLISEDL